METTTDNALIRQEAAVPEKTPGSPSVLYDADVRNRFELNVREGTNLYETAHGFEPLSDERYLQWLKEFKLKGDEEIMDEESREAGCRLWDELIFEVANIDVPEGQDFRTLIPTPEKLEALALFVDCAIGADITRVKGPRKLGSGETQIIPTECFFNGRIATQLHELKKVDIEWQKKYTRIKNKEFKQEKIGGLRRKPKIEYIPQDLQYGELYDDMFVSQEGFANGKIPLRFKTLVINHLFGERLSQKKSQ